MLLEYFLDWIKIVDFFIDSQVLGHSTFFFVHPLSSSIDFLIHFKIDGFDPKENTVTCEEDWREKGIIYGMIGNGYCNDETNNADCNYDGGDCCGPCVVTQYCSDCQCLGGVAGRNGFPNAVGNGYCDDEINNADCYYDGLDWILCQ